MLADFASVEIQASATFGLFQSDVAGNSAAEATLIGILENAKGADGAYLFSPTEVTNIISAAKTKGITEDEFEAAVGTENFINVNLALDSTSAHTQIDALDQVTLDSVTDRTEAFLYDVQSHPDGAGVFEYGQIEPEPLALVVGWLNMSPRGNPSQPETITKYFSGETVTFNGQSSTLDFSPSHTDTHYYLANQTHFREAGTTIYNGFVDRAETAGIKTTYAKTEYGITGELDPDAANYSNEDLADALWEIYDPDGIPASPTTDRFDLGIDPELAASTTGSSDSTAWDGLAASGGGWKVNTDADLLNNDQTTAGGDTDNTFSTDFRGSYKRHGD